MNHSSADSQGEAPIGSPILGPAVPPRSGDREPRRTVIDWASGPFLGRERESDRAHAARPADEPAPGERMLEDEDLPWLSYPGESRFAGERAVPPGPEPGAEGEDAGAAVIESGVLGGGEVSPIELLRPDAFGSESELVAEPVAEQAPDPVTDGAREGDHSAAPRNAVEETAVEEHGGAEGTEGADWYLARPEDADEASRSVEPWEEQVEGLADGDAETEGWFLSGPEESETEGARRFERPDATTEGAAEEGAHREEPGTGNTAAFGDDPYWEPWSEPAEEERAVASGGDDDAGAVPLTGLEIPGASSAVLREIAERLERIARSLRSRESGDLAGDASDPLEVLITGYALGFSEGVRSAGTPHTGGEAD